MSTPVVTMRQLLEAGVHFGHQTRRWNPKMKRFIHGERNGIYIIDLEQTLQRIAEAYAFVRDLTADGGQVLFVGTKRQIAPAVQSYAERCGMPYVNSRWLGGMLTNHETMAKRVGKLKDYERMRDSGEFEAMPKKEALRATRELEKLNRNLGGIRNMDRLPQAVFVLDTKKEAIAVTEAGNDDAIRSGTLMCRVIADAVDEGRFIASRRAPAAPPSRTAEQQAAIDEMQVAARAEAAREAAEREARLAAAADAPAAPAPAADAPAAEAPAAETADAPAPSTPATEES
jgi:small subunit ribosomal protein S2